MNQWSFYTMAIGVFVAIPLFAIVIYLFQGAGDMWSHIVKHFLFDYLENSTILLIGTGLLSLLFGVSAAWIVANYKFPGRKWVDVLLILPIAIPSYIVAYAYVGLLGNGGTLISFLQCIGFDIQKIDMMNMSGLIWVLSCSLFPYVYASSRAIFGSLPQSLFEQSSLLGASWNRYFWRVALPLSIPAILGGLFLVLMEVLNDYGAAKYYGINTFTTGIFRSWTMLEDLQSSIYLAAILVVFVFVILGVVYALRGRRSYAFKGNASTNQNQRKIRGINFVLFPIIILTPIVAGFILPIAQLLYWAALTFDSMWSLHLLLITGQSLFIGVIATAIILLTALALIFFYRWNLLSSIHVFKRLGTIGYVLPGAIIGIGIIRSSQAIINFFHTNFDLEIGHLFYGSSVILIYAYVFRFLAVAYNPLEAHSLKLGKNLSESAYLLGSKRLATLIKVELPLMKNILLSTGLIVLIDILKELPLTLILKPYNIETLAVTAYEYADDERVAEAALPSLCLIASTITIILVVRLLNKRQGRKTHADE